MRKNFKSVGKFKILFNNVHNAFDLFHTVFGNDQRDKEYLAVAAGNDLLVDVGDIVDLARIFDLQRGYVIEIFILFGLFLGIEQFIIGVNTLKLFFVIGPICLCGF